MVSVDPRQIEAVIQFSALLEMLKDPKSFVTTLQAIVAENKVLDEKLSKYEEFATAEDLVNSQKEDLAKISDELKARAVELDFNEKKEALRLAKLSSDLSQKDSVLKAKEDNLVARESALSDGQDTLANKVQAMVEERAVLARWDETLNAKEAELQQKVKQLKALMGQ